MISTPIVSEFEATDQGASPIAQFIAAVVKTQEGNIQLLPLELSEKINPFLSAGEPPPEKFQEIIRCHQEEETTNDIEGVQTTEPRHSTSGPHPFKEKGLLVHSELVSEKYDRGTHKIHHEIWLLSNRRLLICKVESSQRGMYDLGTSASGIFNERWSFDRLPLAVLQIKNACKNISLTSFE